MRAWFRFRQARSILGLALAVGMAGAGLAAPAIAPPTWAPAAAPGAENWVVLSSTKVTVDEKAGVYHAAHPAAVQGLQGKALTLSGWMMPLDPSEASTHFLLLAYPMSCPFCNPANPNEVVEVYTAKPVPFSYDMVSLTGEFSIQNNEAAGLFFRLDKATSKKG